MYSGMKRRRKALGGAPDGGFDATNVGGGVCSMLSES